MNIYELDSVFSPTILERGYSYFKEGKVLELVNVRGGRYRALVAGSEIYTVHVTLVGDSSFCDMDCTCPFAEHSYCKHEAAVLFALSEKGHRLAREGLDERLEGCSRRELLRLVKELAHSDRDSISRIFSAAERVTERDILERFRRTLFGSGASERFDISLTVDAFYEALEDIDELEDTDLMTRTQLGMLSSLEGCASVSSRDREELNGLSDVLARRMAELNREIIARGEPEASKQWAVMLAAKSLLSFDDGEERWFRILLPFADRDARREDYLALLDGSEDSTDIKLRLADELYTEAELEEFIEANRSSNSVLDFAFKRAAERDEWERAEDFARAACLLGTVSRLEWLRRLRDVYEVTEQREKLVSTLYELVLHGSTQSYEELCDLLSDEEYEKTKERLLEAPENKSYVYILKREQLTERAIELCRRQKESVAELAALLAATEHREEARAIFTGLIRERAAVSSYRSMYSEVAKLLVRFMSVFGRRAAEKLTAELRGRYEHRPAFIEELDKAGL